MTLLEARDYLADIFGREPEKMIDQWILVCQTNGTPRRVLFVGLAPDERGDWIAILRSHEGVLDLYTVHPSYLSRIPS